MVFDERYEKALLLSRIPCIMFVMALDIQIVNDEKVLLECILNFDYECLIGDGIILVVSLCFIFHACTGIASVYLKQTGNILH